MRATHALLCTSAIVLAACAKSATNGNALTDPSTTGVSANAVEQQLAWGPAPAVFPAGAEMVVMQGDPSKAEPFTVRGAIGSRRAAPSMPPARWPTESRRRSRTKRSAPPSSPASPLASPPAPPHRPPAPRRKR